MASCFERCACVPPPPSEYKLLKVENGIVFCLEKLAEDEARGLVNEHTCVCIQALERCWRDVVVGVAEGDSLGLTLRTAGAHFCRGCEIVFGIHDRFDDFGNLVHVGLSELIAWIVVL
ncbi:hypothetical protein AeRB84_006005 [Aphanomyces euteiches]|nr:hypothetical protein AeRB84_006005 [Aphanomyces euteiches]